MFAFMKKFFVYLTAGYPSLEDSFRLMQGISDLVDGIEIGIPFTDPLADGPTIQMASSYALAKGLRVRDVFEATKSLAKKISTPLYFMTYYNIVYQAGVVRFCRESKKIGVQGLIVPDVPLEESDELNQACWDVGLENIMFITPVSDDERIRMVLAVSRGFVYYVSVTGITGVREKVNKEALTHIKRIKNKFKPDIPVMLGFGISSPETVAQACEVADGVIVGSAVINEIDPKSSWEENLSKIRRKIEWMRQGLK